LDKLEADMKKELIKVFFCHFKIVLVSFVLFCWVTVFPEKNISCMLL